MSSTSTFDANYALLMERFPKSALLIPQKTKREAMEDPPPSLSISEEVDILYCLGIRACFVYFPLRLWLQKSSSRRLIFIDRDMSPLLYEERAKQVLEDPQVLLEEPSSLSDLIRRFPSSRVEVMAAYSYPKSAFYRKRLEILRKSTLSSALHRDRLHGEQLFSNFLKNIKEVPRSFYANYFKGSFKGIPAIVCGAGPSLNRSIADLKVCQDKALIIAGGSTLAALSAEGIMPHLGMAIDPNLEEYRRLRNSFAFHTPLLYSTRVFPAIFQTSQGPFGYMRSGMGGALELWLEEELELKHPFIGENLPEEAISVTVMCIALAQELGCSPIYLSGIDLAYTDGKRYAKGVGVDDGLTQEKLSEKGAPDRILFRKNGLGKKVATATRWVMEANAISELAKQFPEVSFFNTGKEGLVLPNIPYRTLESLMRDSPRQIQKKVESVLENAKMPPQTAQIIRTQMGLLLKSLNRVIQHLEVLSQKKSPLDELELKEEMAYAYLFYDMIPVIRREIEMQVPEKAAPLSIWQRFLSIAIKYRQVVDPHIRTTYCGVSEH